MKCGCYCCADGCSCCQNGCRCDYYTKCIQKTCRRPASKVMPFPLMCVECGRALDDCIGKVVGDVVEVLKADARRN